MIDRKILNVFYHGREVGRSALTKENLCAFEYDTNWISDGFSISPFKLPLKKGVFIAEKEPFSGNFGVFDDSLPDGWGTLLVDRMLSKRRINPASVSILERLSIVGKSGRGALEYYPENELVKTFSSGNLTELSEECGKILAGVPSDNIDKIRELSGSSGGARPKVLIDFKDENWIVKFRSSSDPKDIGLVEYEYSKIAKNAGIEMPETRLFDGKFFGVKRFDRKSSGEKIHMLSVCGLLNASHRYPSLDYIDILKATYELTRDYRELEKLFRIMCFNVIGHNKDDHSKNFSFLYDAGRWKLSPAYDLVPSEGIFGEHATMVAGNGKNPSESDILKVAEEIGMKKSQAKDIYMEVKQAFEESDIIHKLKTMEDII